MIDFLLQCPKEQIFHITVVAICTTRYNINSAFYSHGDHFNGELLSLGLEQKFKMSMLVFWVVTPCGRVGR